MSDALPKYSSDNLNKVIGKLDSAKTTDQFNQALAELAVPNRLITTGQVAENSEIIIGAEAGTKYSLGSVEVNPAPVPDADVLYLSKDGIVNIIEIKNTANALRQKLIEKPQQLKNLRDWVQEGSNRAARIAIEQEKRWTDIFYPLKKGGKKPILQELIKANVSLSIGSRNLDITKMKELRKVAQEKYNELVVESGQITPQQFFNQISTIQKAENFLGISL